MKEIKKETGKEKKRKEEKRREEKRREEKRREEKRKESQMVATLKIRKLSHRTKVVTNMLTQGACKVIQTNHVKNTTGIELIIGPSDTVTSLLIIHSIIFLLVSGKILIPF
jgi:Skp family chaperone for outer membrane proteins